jgi:hypothetical protein
MGLEGTKARNKTENEKEHMLIKERERRREERT